MRILASPEIGPTHDSTANGADDSAHVCVPSLGRVSRRKHERMMRALLLFALRTVLVFSGPSMGARMQLPAAHAATLASAGDAPFLLPKGDVVHFISPTGKDGASGLTPATAWATPNHSMHCGDVIVALSGVYTSGFSKWGAVSNCPSTTGGIDGAGGINFAVLLCAGPNLGSCSVSPSSGNAFDVTKNNWAVEGFNASTHAPSSGQAFFADACTNGMRHHVAFINDVATDTGYGFDTTDCGSGNGEDYIAYVGGIAANANNYSGGASFCGGAIDMNAPKNLDTDPGTHMLVKGMFAFNNVGPPLLTVNAGSLRVGAFYHVLSVGTTDWTAIGAKSNTAGVFFRATGAGSGTGTATTTQCTSDVEPFIWDVWGRFPYTGQGYASDNIAWRNGGHGFQIFGGGTSTLTMIIDHMTLFDSCSALPDGAGFFFNCSEVNFGTGNASWNISLTNSILNTNKAVGVPLPDNGPAYATNFDSIPATTSFPPNVTGNILWSIATGCEGRCSPSARQPISISCCGRHGVPLAPPSGTFEDPRFTNTSDLMTNWLASPTCSGFADVAACMGWNYSTQTATALTPISDLTPTSGGANGKGYRPPGRCAADANYPAWLKGIVYLHWNGKALTENAGLVTKPCGM